MAYIDWKISGPKISSCNCDYGCPCEFNGRPTNDMCEGMEAMRIDEGYFGDVRLDGLMFAARFRWPGAVHEGGGTVQGVIDDRASEAQREALFKILDGEEQEPTTLFNIYGSTIDTELDPIFTKIEFECDINAARGWFSVPDMMRLDLEPINNPVTGNDHRAQIRLPNGFEFNVGEMASGSFQATGKELGMVGNRVYGLMMDVAYGPYGIIEDRLAS